MGFAEPLAFACVLAYFFLSTHLAHNRIPLKNRVRTPVFSCFCARVLKAGFSAKLDSGLAKSALHFAPKIGRHLVRGACAALVIDKVPSNG